MNDAFKRAIEAEIQRKAHLEDFVAVLREFRDKGMSASSANTVLESLRADAADELTEDRILEVMDIVAGFCSPHLRVWNERSAGGGSAA